jgi:hypothetical protein
MKQLKNQQGYALLIVLLIVVLFLSISATFMAGSLSNAKQEKTVDTTNQSVASAEMGVRYYTADFKREIELIKQDVSAQTQFRINDLIACIQPPRGTQCDSDTKITAIEDQIDEDMRALYIQKILAKVTELNALASGSPIEPFTSDDISYGIGSATGLKLDSTGTVTADMEAVKRIKIDLVTIGTSDAISKELKGLFSIEVPDTFLNPSEALTVETEITVDNDNVSYTDIFDLAEPTISCTDLLTELTRDLDDGETRPSPIYECKLAEGETLTGIISLLKSKGFSPTDFKVFTDDFAKNVCPQSCNVLDLEGISLSVDTIDENAFNNMNNLINANIIVNGELGSGNNLINLGKNDSRQIIIVKELDVGSNIQNLYYTNLLVLGDSDANLSDSKLQWGQNFEIDNYSKLCIDIDQILPDDLERLRKEVKFSNSGSIVYYSRNTEDFILKSKVGSNYVNDTERTTQFVKRMPDYTTFLAACDVEMSKTIIDSTEVAVPNVLEPDFDFEVEY